MKIAICAFLLFFTSHIFAAKISGTITDAVTQELLIGAAVILESNNSDKTYQAISGLDGSYSISGIAPGSYKLIISYLGFLEITEQLTFSTESEVLLRDFSMASNAEMLSEVIIRADNQGTDAQARSLEKQSASVINIISSKQIMISPDITVANVIQRVSGLSIERNASGDPQYAIVRGMDKRYNNTLVNGIKIPSPDNENRFVPLDIFPAVFLERLEVYKSLTANMEADAIGGTVNMVMKNAPYQFVLDGDVQIGYNQLNFERDFATYDRSKLNRRSPKEIHGKNYRATPADFPVENMTAEYIRPLPDVIASVTYGDRFLGKKLGLMLGGSFQNSYRPVSNYFYDPSVNFLPGNPLIMQELIERETSSQFQRIAFHGKLDYDLNERHNVNFYFGKYLLNEFRVRDQLRRESFVTENNYAVYPVTRFSNIFQDITTFDFSGTSKLATALDLKWHAVYSIASNDRPDDGVFSRAGQFDTDLNQVTNEIVYFQGTRNSRAWERNQDNDLSVYADFTYKPYIFNEHTELQLGGVFRDKTRDNYFNYYNYSQIFGQFRGVDWNNFGEVKFNTMANPLGSGDRSNLIYDATERIYAGYVNSKWKFGVTDIQVGLRAEMTEQSYEINELSASSNEIETSKTQNYAHLFPALSIKHAITDKAYLKGTYYKGISRPGFYEIVPTIRNNGGGDSFYSERGNADLRPSIGHNADLRYEFFPSFVDQILLGVFFKQIIDPIEFGFPQVSSAEESPNTNQILPQNYSDATNFGFEADFTKYFNKFGIRLNYTYTQSRITTSKVVINEDRSRSLVDQTRPLQGQSDHIGNLSLLYKDQQRKLDMQIVLNYTGERIAFVSPFLEADHYLKPMVQLDFSAEKGINKRMVIFIKANNLLNTPFQLYVKKPLANPTDPYPYQTDPYNQAFVRRDLYGLSYRLGFRVNLN